MLTRVGVRDTARLLPSKMVDTPEGYLLCRDVVLARTGHQDYGFWEVPREIRDARKGNMVRVYRHEDDVFSPETIESFRGRPFTDDHPDDDVGPDNYHQLMKGVVQNPRRGAGPNRDHLVGDVLIYDRGTIAKVRGGKREVSCGYDASYDVVDGRAYQRKITGNHVSLVDAGRCGPACSIKDGKSTGTTEIENMAFSKTRFMDALKSVLRSKAKDDSPEHKAAMEALESELPEDEREEENDEDGRGGDAKHHHVTVNIGGSLQGGADKARDARDKNNDRRSRDARQRDGDEDYEETPREGVDGVNAEELAAMITAATQKAVETAVAPLAARIQAIEEAVEDVSDPDDVMTQDSVARAEVLKPGFTMPVFDAKPGSKGHRDAIVAMQRKVLAESFATRDGRSVILPLVSSNRPDFGKMNVETLGVVFRGASAAMATRNNDRAQPEYRGSFKDDSGQRRPITQDSWNKTNKDFWKKQAPAH